MRRLDDDLDALVRDDSSKPTDGRRQIQCRWTAGTVFNLQWAVQALAKAQRCPVWRRFSARHLELFSLGAIQIDADHLLGAITQGKLVMNDHGSSFHLRLTGRRQALPNFS
jgi:hypothetical protein